jgi:hypothetical protein
MYVMFGRILKEKTPGRANNDENKGRNQKYK